MAGCKRARMAGTSAFTAVEWRILAATILGSSLTFIDGTVVNLSLIHI